MVSKMASGSIDGKWRLDAWCTVFHTESVIVCLNHDAPKKNWKNHIWEKSLQDWGKENRHMLRPCYHVDMGRGEQGNVPIQ